VQQWLLVSYCLGYELAQFGLCDPSAELMGPVDPPKHSFGNIVGRGMYVPVYQTRHEARVRITSRECVQNLKTALLCDVSDQRAEFRVGRLQHLVDALHMRRPLWGPPLARSSQFALLSLGKNLGSLAKRTECPPFCDSSAALRFGSGPDNDGLKRVWLSCREPAGAWRSHW